MSQLNIYTYKKKNLEHNCILQESSKIETLVEICSTCQGRSLG